ncbi:MAG TPA: hypothetical protein VEL31_31325 [Ktedonobacteraceae bacterium]|nr:hypothetical protein [Ktedonobacteraceae bacterium]
MSHIVEAKTAIVQPDTALLHQAATLVAQQHAGTLETFYLDYYGKRHSAPLAIHIPELRRGIGIKVDETTGELTFVGDSWGVVAMYQQVQQEILQTYVSLATMQALQQMGYSTQALDGEQGQVVIQGVTYA